MAQEAPSETYSRILWFLRASTSILQNLTAKILPSSLHPLPRRRGLLVGRLLFSYLFRAIFYLKECTHTPTSQQYYMLQLSLDVLQVKLENRRIMKHRVGRPMEQNGIWGGFILNLNGLKFILKELPFSCVTTLISCLVFKCWLVGGWHNKWGNICNHMTVPQILHIFLPSYF